MARRPKPTSTYTGKKVDSGIGLIFICITVVVSLIIIAVIAPVIIKICIESTVEQVIGYIEKCKEFIAGSGIGTLVGGVIGYIFRDRQSNS